MNRTVQVDITPRSRAHRIAAALAVLALFAFAGAPLTHAVTPAPDGNYPGMNTAEGQNALFSLTTGVDNTALGYQTLYSDKTGSNNTAVGWNALRFNTSGNDNTGTGAQALYKNTTGNGNTALGRNALLLNTTDSGNTGIGFQALQNTTSGSSSSDGASTAVGYQAGAINMTGLLNAFGYQALYNNTNGVENDAFGRFALFSNTTGEFNDAFGDHALASVTSTCCNNAFGNAALANSTGTNNTAVGDLAGISLFTGDGNVYIGADVFGVDGDNNTTRIRNIYDSVASDRQVYVNSDNKLGTLVSSRRFKDDIKPIENASDVILALKPVSFRYKKEFDAHGTKHFGLVAEDVAKVDPDLVTRDKEGRPETVRYEAVNAMLLNEFLKEHHKVEQLQDKLAKQQKQIEALTQGLQKVSAELELNKPQPHLVGNSR